MSETEPLLDVGRVAKRYGSVTALAAADLAVRPGEIHALLGANGAGKSTLVKVLAGVVPADSGTVRLAGTEVRPTRPLDAYRAGFAAVFQDPAFAPDLTLAQNLRLAGVDRRRLADWLVPLELDRLDMDTVARDVPLPALRMLDLARALTHRPRLLMLDEITAALPGDRVDLVFDVMNRWRDQGRSVLFISHRLREVVRMCDRATVLRDGSTVAVLGTAEGERPMVEAMLGPVAETPVGRSVLVQAVHGRSPTGEPAVERADDSETENGKADAAGGRIGAHTVFEARSLTARGLPGVSFALRAGEILGLAALEGQGQDRLFDVLSGDRPADSGELVVNGSTVRPRSPYDLIRAGVVLVPADRLHGLLPRQSVRSNLASALYNRASRWFSLAADEDERVQRSIDRLAIDTRAHQQVQRLSGGNQQKVVIGRWLAAGFRTLLCFDPTRGIDVRTKEQIYRLLRELADDGASILYYSSEFTELPHVCDRVLVMYGGAIVRELPARSADEATLMHAAHGLDESSLGDGTATADGDSGVVGP